MNAERRKEPVSRDPGIVRRRILEAAEAEFMEHGYEAASTNRITERFGGSKATLFRHFKSKEDLLEAVVRSIAMQWQQAKPWEGLPTQSPRAWLAAVAVRTLDWILGDRPIFVGRLAIAEGSRLPALERIFETTATRPIRDLIAQQLGLWTREGLLDCAHPRQDAERFIDLAISGHVSRRLYGEPRMSAPRLDGYVRRSVELFLHGCAPGDG